LNTLALVGDIEAARVVSDALGRLLGSHATGARVVDLELARRPREDEHRT
jgi:hypothetical protein